MTYQRESIVNQTIRPALRSYWPQWILVAFSLVLAAVVAGYEGVGGQIPGAELLGAYAQLMGEAAAMLALAFGGFVVLMGIVIPYFSHRYFLSETHVTAVEGLIRKETFRARLDKIQNDNPRVGYIGRVIGYGDLDFFTSGTGDSDISFKGIRLPHELSEVVQSLTSELDDGESRSGANQQELERVRDELERERAQRKEIERRLGILEWQVFGGGAREAQGANRMGHEPAQQNSGDEVLHADAVRDLVGESQPDASGHRRGADEAPLSEREVAAASTPKMFADDSQEQGSRPSREEQRPDLTQPDVDVTDAAGSEESRPEPARKDGEGKSGDGDAIGLLMR